MLKRVDQVLVVMFRIGFLGSSRLFIIDSAAFNADMYVKGEWSPSLGGSLVLFSRDISRSSKNETGGVDGSEKRIDGSLKMKELSLNADRIFSDLCLSIRYGFKSARRHESS